MNLKQELKLIVNELNFHEHKPMLYAVEEAGRTLYFDYRAYNKRKSYAMDEHGKPMDKKQFHAYTMFKMLCDSIEKQEKPKLDEFSLSQEIDDWLQDYNYKKEKSTIEKRAKFIIEELKKKL